MKSALRAAKTSCAHSSDSIITFEVHTVNLQSLIANSRLLTHPVEFSICSLLKQSYRCCRYQCQGSESCCQPALCYSTTVQPAPEPHTKQTPDRQKKKPLN